MLGIRAGIVSISLSSLIYIQFKAATVCQYTLNTHLRPFPHPRQVARSAGLGGWKTVVCCQKTSMSRFFIDHLNRTERAHVLKSLLLGSQNSSS